MNNKLSGRVEIHVIFLTTGAELVVKLAHIYGLVLELVVRLAHKYGLGEKTSIAQCDHFQQFYNRCNVKVCVPIIRWSHCALPIYTFICASVTTIVTICNNHISLKNDKSI